MVSWYQPGTSGDVHLPPFGVQAHYVSYPQGVVSADPADQFTNGDDGFGWRSSAAPGLRGTGPVGYYDVAVKRFLPVPRAQVSPDGRRYVYMDYTQGGLYVYGQIHVVDVATGRDRTLDLPAAQYEIFDFSADGIYFTVGPYGQSAGLLLLNPDSVATRQVFQDGYVIAVANGEAWLIANEQDLHPTSPLPGGEGNATVPVLNVLLRRDLKSGQVTEWLRRPINTWTFELLGVYGGAPALLVYLADANDARWSTGKVPYEVWLLSRPATPEKVDVGVAADLQLDPWYQTGRNGLGISDSHGIWLGGQAIYLYQPDQGLTKIATFPGFPANGCM
ncbi:MAG: TolB-like translocation protein [Candidatus Dormibacteraceae bacterium]